MEGQRGGENKERKGDGRGKEGREREEEGLRHGC